MKRHQWFCIGIFLFFFSRLCAQNTPVVERLYAAVLGPSAISLNSSAPLSSGGTGIGELDLIKTLRQYIERQLTCPGGLYVSAPDSANWQSVSWPNLRLRAITMAMVNGQPKLFLGAENGVLRPFANATNWQLLSDWQLAPILDFERDPFYDQTLYVCTANGIFISHDSGMTWQPAHQGLESLFVNCLLADAKQKGRLLAGTEKGLFQSLNGGNDWQLLALSGIPVRAVLREPESWPGIFWVGTEYHGLYESIDGGLTFAPVFLGEDSVSIYALAGGGANRPIYAGAYQRGLFFASSAGQNWQQMPRSEKLGSVLCILPLPDRKILYVGTYDRGVYISRDMGETWRAFGLTGAHVRQLVIGEPNWITP